jgi:Rrf2 family protein
MRTRQRDYPDSAPALLLYSRTCQHALRAMERLAAHERTRPGTFRRLDALARQIGATPDALGQIAASLRRAGLLRARPGPSGGVRLARPPWKISVLEVIRVVDGKGLEGRCILGFPVCGDATACPAHPVWKRARALLEARLESRSLEDLSRSVERKSAALARRSAIARPRRLRRPES